MMGGFKNWRCGADTDFKDRIRCNKKIRYSTIKDIVFFYRKGNPNSLTACKKYGIGSEERIKYNNMLHRRTTNKNPIIKLEIIKIEEITI
jgi:hypothetical protein